MRTLNAKNLVVYRVNRFHIKNLKKLKLIRVSVYPPSLTPCILIYL